MCSHKAYVEDPAFTYKTMANNKDIEKKYQKEMKIPKTLTKEKAKEILSFFTKEVNKM
jgi:hypothetical protein